MIFRVKQVPDLLTYSWECPICGRSKQGFSHKTTKAGTEVANLLLRHVIATAGDGHGREGQLPEGLDEAMAKQYVDIRGRTYAAATRPSP